MASNSDEQFCLINDEKTVQEIKDEITALRDRWNSDMGTIKGDLGRLIVFVNDVSDRYDNIDPILSSFTEKLDNINKNQEKNYKNLLLNFFYDRKIMLVSTLGLSYTMLRLFK